MVDANVLIAAIGWRRWPYYVLRHAAAGDFQLVLSQRLIDEARDEIAARFNARVDYFVSEDKHFTAKTERTRTLHRRLRIMLSGTFLRHVMKSSGEQLEAARARDK
jgi:hypothetical protein